MNGPLLKAKTKSKLFIVFYVLSYQKRIHRIHFHNISPTWGYTS